MFFVSYGIRTIDTRGSRASSSGMAITVSQISI